MSNSLFLGLNSSTQSFSGIVIDPTTGVIVYQDSVKFGSLSNYGLANGFVAVGDTQVFSPPLMWAEALEMFFQNMTEALGPEVISRIKGIGGAGQQHGTVYLSHAGVATWGKFTSTSSLVSQLSQSFSRALSPIWMDSSTGKYCEQLSDFAGGGDAILKLSGSIATERFSGAQILKFAKTSPLEWKNTGHVALVSSFICSILTGKIAPVDQGDAAGTNLMDISKKDWCPDLLMALSSRTSKNWRDMLPVIKPTTYVAGTISDFFVERFGFSKECEVLTFSGDNPLSLLGMGVHSIDDRKTVLSLGTSGTGFALTKMSYDPNGFGNVMVSVTKPEDHLMLLCFKNDSLAREAVRNRLFPGDDWTKFNEAIEASPPGNGGDFMIPFFAPEITPKTNEAVVKFFGNLNQNSPRTARAVVEAQFLNMAHFFKLLGIQTPEILVTGGASLNPSILQIGADIMNSTFCLLETPEDAVQKKPNTDSVSLGGAILSASAIGKFEIRELTMNFCAPKGARYTPNSYAAYDDLRLKFAEELNRLTF